MKAIIESGGKQYLVEKGSKLRIELVDGKKEITFEALSTVDGKKTKVGTPTVSGSKVKAKVIDQVKDDKVTAIRYKAKKRVNKRRGHKQSKSLIEIISVQ